MYINMPPTLIYVSSLGSIVNEHACNIDSTNSANSSSLSLFVSLSLSLTYTPWLSLPQSPSAVS